MDQLIGRSTITEYTTLWFLWLIISTSPQLPYFRCILLSYYPIPGYSGPKHPTEPRLDFPIPPQPNTSLQRPGVVSAISIYQFLKAIYLVFVFFWVGLKSEIPLVHIGPFSHSAANLVMLAVGISSVFIGVVAHGLWNLQSWARHAMLPPWGIAYWITTNHNEDLMQTGFYDVMVPVVLIGALVLLDLLSYLLLVLYPDIARTFNDRKIGLFGL